MKAAFVAIALCTCASLAPVATAQTLETVQPSAIRKAQADLDRVRADSAKAKAQLEKMALSVPAAEAHGAVSRARDADLRESDAEASFWRTLVASLPAPHWGTSPLPQLTDTHTAALRDLSDELNALRRRIDRLTDGPPGRDREIADALARQAVLTKLRDLYADQARRHTEWNEHQKTLAPIEEAAKSAYDRVRETLESMAKSAELGRAIKEHYYFIWDEEIDARAEAKAQAQAARKAGAGAPPRAR